MTDVVRRAEAVARETMDVVADRTAQLQDLFPEAFTDGRVDFDRLRAALGDPVDDRPERYSFTWAGKRDAMRILQMPTRATLVPAPEESVDWDTTNHLFIEGDNLEVLKLLLKPYYGRVKLIYIDPPYNTGNDFIYPDNYADPLDTYLKLTGQKDADGNLLTSNPETSGRYHSAWLSMMYPRLFLARQLLREDGIIFVSIDDHEVHNLRLLMNEVFGEENFGACVVWQKMDSPSRNDAGRAVTGFHDYILLYARSRGETKLKQMAKPEILKAYPLQLEDGRLARARQLRKNGKNARREDRPSMWYPLEAPDGSTVWPIAPEGWEGRWVLSLETWRERENAGLTRWVKRHYGWVPYYIETAPDEPTVPWSTLWTDVDQNRQAKAKFTALMGSNVAFDDPKPCDLILNMLRMAANHDDLVMDFFAGSCSTAEAVLRLNHEDQGDRHFIMVRLPEPTGNSEYPTIAEIGKERIRRVVSQIKQGDEGKMDLDERDTTEDLGFRVFRLAPSNFRSWPGVTEADPEAYAGQMAVFLDALVDGWTAERVITEVALKEAGFGLNYQVERVAAAAAQAVYRVSDPDKEQVFYICLDERIALEQLAALGLDRDDLFVCRASALDDEGAANLALQCRRLKTV